MTHTPITRLISAHVSAYHLLGLLLCCAGLADAQTFDSCDILAYPVLPLGCACSNEAAGANVQCTQQAGLLTLTTGLTIQPCASPAAIVFTIQVNDQPWTHTITSGESGSVPIPGLFYTVGVASIGVVLEYNLEGNADSMDVQIAFNACGEFFFRQTCLGDVEIPPFPPSVFPVQLLDTTLDFGACPPTTTAPTGSPVTDASRGYVQISTASQHCPGASRTSMESGFDDRDACYQVCRERDGCVAFAWNPVETGSGNRYCMTCSSTDMTADNNDLWETYEMVFSEPPTTSDPTPYPTSSPTPNSTTATTSTPDPVTTPSPSVTTTSTADPTPTTSAPTTTEPTTSDPTPDPTSSPTPDPTTAPITSAPASPEPTTSDPAPDPTTAPITSAPTTTEPTTSDPTPNPTPDSTISPTTGPPTSPPITTTPPPSPTLPPTPPPTTSPPTASAASSKDLELTFPGDLDTIIPANQEVIKDAIKTNVEAVLGTGAVERVELSAGSFQATVTFTDSVTAAQIDGLGIMYTNTPMVVSAGGDTMTSAAASSVDTAAGSPSSSPDDGLSGDAVAGIVVALLLVAGLAVIGAIVYRQRKERATSSGNPTNVPSINNPAHTLPSIEVEASRPLTRVRGSVTDIEKNPSV